MANFCRVLSSCFNCFNAPEDTTHEQSRGPNRAGEGGVKTTNKIDVKKKGIQGNYSNVKARGNKLMDHQAEHMGVQLGTIDLEK